MNIEEIRIAKMQVEVSIAEVLRSFEEATGLSVRSVHIDTADRIDTGRTVVLNVTLDIKI